MEAPLLDALELQIISDLQIIADVPHFLVFIFPGHLMELFDALDTRSSAGRLTIPGPNPEEMGRLLRAADRAPDHGRLKPWRFIVLSGAARESFAAAAAAAKRRRLPAMSEEQLAMEREKILSTPTLVIAACAVDRSNNKIPEIEQVIAVGAAVENLFLAAHGLGYGVMWKTGAAAYDPAVKTELGLQPDDHVVAILHLGTRVK